MSEGKQKKTASFKAQPELYLQQGNLTSGQENEDDLLSNEETATEDDAEAKYRQDVLRAELAAMIARDENAKARWRTKRNEERQRAVEALQKERSKKGISITPDAVNSKRAIRKVVNDEEIIALKPKMAELQTENAKIMSQIDDKLGISALPKGKELVALAEDFYVNQHSPNDHLPENIRLALTTEEIQDLRRVFELFDAKNRGYITANDLRRAAAMLGFTAKRRVFQEMIDDTPTSKKGKVTFIAFLELVIKIQGDGPDPFDEMKQFFHLLDKDGKGFVTFKDIRAASDQLKIPLSNNAIRDMMVEADPQGHGKIRLQDLIAVLGQSGTFKSVVPIT